MVEAADAAWEPAGDLAAVGDGDLMGVADEGLVAAALVDEASAEKASAADFDFVDQSPFGTSDLL